MKKIITTVGTSLFTNFMQDKVKNEYGRNYSSISIEHAYNSIDREKVKATGIWDTKYKHFIARIKESVSDYWFDEKFTDNDFASAEIASTLKIVGNEEKEAFEIHLIATDTLLSVLAAELIRDWFIKHKHLAGNISDVLFQRPQSDFKDQKDSQYVVKDMRVDDQEKYMSGFMNLMHLLDRIVGKEGYIINITGGYKGIVPLMTIFGQLREVPVKYLFEEKYSSEYSEVVSIGNLPINFDWSIGELFLDDITKDGLRTLSQKPEILRVLRTMNVVNDDNFKLSPLGQMFRDYIIPLVNNKKSDFGYFVELKLFEHFSHLGHKSVRRGKSYWWHVQDRSNYSDMPQYGKDNKKEVAIEIDIVIEFNTGIKEWCEVKSWSSTGLRKAKEQLETKINFLKEVDLPAPGSFKLLLYKLPDSRLDSQSNLLKEIFEIGKDAFDYFAIEYIDIPISNKGLPNTKKFSEQEVDVKTLNPEVFLA